MKTKILKADSKTGFFFLEGLNRPIFPSHVSKIVASILLFGGIIRPVIVTRLNYLGKKGLYIIDGQHLYLAALRLKMDIPYIEIDVKNTEDLIGKIASVNASSKSWTLSCYIDAWAYYKESYKEFREIFNLYNIERTMLAELLHTGVVAAHNASSNSPIGRTIKEGNLRIINKKQALRVLGYVSDLRNITSDIGRHEQRLVLSVP